MTGMHIGDDRRGYSLDRPNPDIPPEVPPPDPEPGPPPEIPPPDPTDIADSVRRHSKWRRIAITACRASGDSGTSSATSKRHTYV